jgi:hypothetical protein
MKEFEELQATPASLREALRAGVQEWQRLKERRHRRYRGQGRQREPFEPQHSVTPFLPRLLRRCAARVGLSQAPSTAKLFKNRMIRSMFLRSTSMIAVIAATAFAFSSASRVFAQQKDVTSV